MEDSCVLAPETDIASILVVSDSPISAKRLDLLLYTLGPGVEIASGAGEVRRRLLDRPVDLVLIDNVTSDFDSLCVLSSLKDDRARCHIPVIVVSAFDTPGDSALRAIRLGALDVLPRNFDPEVLRARADAALAAKRCRDEELAHIRDMGALIDAADVIGSGAFRPSDLQIARVAARPDELGRLATVFHSLAEAIYHREQRLDRRLRTLWGMMMVIIAGGLIAIEPSLSRIGTRLGAPPLGLAICSDTVGATACLAIGIARSGFPRIRLRHMRFLLLWAVVMGCLYKVWLVVVAEHVEASMIALILSSRAFMVFALAALIALERPNMRRLAGLGIGFVAVAVVLVSRGIHTGDASAVWLIAALGVPALLAIHTLLMAWRPPDLEAFTTTGAMLAISSVFLVPMAVATHQLFLPPLVSGRLGVVILVLGMATGVAVALALVLVGRTGAVFASQMSYIQTLAGIAWGILLLNERLSIVAWGALTLVILGSFLVQPKQAGEEFSAKIPIRPPKAPAMVRVTQDTGAAQPRLRRAWPG